MCHVDIIKIVRIPPTAKDTKRVLEIEENDNLKDIPIQLTLYQVRNITKNKTHISKHCFISCHPLLWNRYLLSGCHYCSSGIIRGGTATISRAATCHSCARSSWKVYYMSNHYVCVYSLLYVLFLCALFGKAAVELGLKERSQSAAKLSSFPSAGVRSPVCWVSFVNLAIIDTTRRLQLFLTKAATKYH